MLDENERMAKSLEERLEEQIEEKEIGAFNHKGNQPFPMGGKESYLSMKNYQSKEVAY